MQTEVAGVGNYRAHRRGLRPMGPSQKTCGRACGLVLRDFPVTDGHRLHAGAIT